MSKSELGWTTLFIVAIATFAWWRLSPHPTRRPPPAASAEEEVLEPTPPPAPVAPSPPPVTPAPPPPVRRSQEVAVKKDPRRFVKRFDPKKERKLEAEKPKSIKELLDDRTGFQLPHLPTETQSVKGPVDNDIWAFYAGYIIYADNTIKKLRMQRAFGNLRIAIEEDPGNIKDWTEHDGQLKLNNFKGDPYSLVMETPDGRLFYLKFQPEANVQGYVKPLRVMAGWLLSDATTSASVARVAMLDIQAHIREYPPGMRGAEEWPKVGALKALTTDLPAETPEP
jgi:hypothetical protein